MLRKDLVSLTLPLALAACGSSGTAATLPSAATANDGPLRASVQRLAVAWNAGDGDAWAAEFWPDGSLVNILGVVFPTATAVAGVTRTILAGPFQGSSFGPVIRRIRFAGSDAAIVDADISVTNYRALPPGAIATSPGLLLTRLTLVFTARNSVWKIEAAQNTAVQPSSA